MRPRVWLSLFCVLMIPGGCSKPPSIATYPVTGTVTYNDKALVGATVSFVSDNPDAPRSSGITDEDGKFRLTTYVNATQVLAGVPAGDYNVLVLKNPAVGDTGSASTMEQLSPEERITKMQKMMQQQLPVAQGERPQKPKSEVPEKYTSIKTTPLKHTVAAGENPPVEFKLRD
jgi:hypothetical protein